MIWYPWLTPLYQQLVQQHHRARGHHAQLLYATPGCGAEQLVVTFARWILCCQPQSPTVGGCSKCHACTLMQAGSHPDCLWVELQNEKSQLGVEQIRMVLPSLYTLSQQGGAKVIAFLESERLSEAAANALLKILEEPPPETYFLLLCRTDVLLPATIRSRCQQWYLSVPPPPQAVAWIQKQDDKVTPSQAMGALRRSLGAPLEALALLQGALLQRGTTLSQALITALAQQDLLLLHPQLDHNDVQWSLCWLATLWLDASKQRLQVVVSDYQLDYSAVVVDLATRFTNHQLQQCCQCCLSCRHSLRVTPSLNRTLLLTELLCRLQDHLSL